jgi:UDP-3-O-[3-hydroxymyristoyl] glucosamine N-acyltransferase
VAMRLGELAERLECRLVGDGEIEVTGLATVESAGHGDLTFVAHARYLPAVEAGQASAVILRESDPACSKPTLRTADPYAAFAKALLLFYPPEAVPVGVHPSAIVHPDARLEDEVSVGPFCVIDARASIGRRTVVGAQVYIGKDARIGADGLIYPQVVVRERTEIGDRVIIHAGTVIGSDGFGYLTDVRGRRRKIPQVGRVVVEDDAEIGANVTIDRATVGTTRIKRGTKIDNLVQVAHNVVVGEDTVIVALAGVSGSTRIGDRVTIAGQVGIVDHVEIGDDVTIGAQAGVTNDVPAGAVVLGSPAVAHLEFKRGIAAVRRLPGLVKNVQAIEARLRALEQTAQGRAKPAAASESAGQEG